MSDEAQVESSSAHEQKFEVSEARVFGNSKVFLTGASGHLGANLVRRLLAEGDDVRVLVEPGSRANNAGITDLDVECIEGDLRNPELLIRAMAGCARVYHVAAKVATKTASAEEEREIYEINTLGTQNIVEACLANRVERLCLTGSFSGVGFDRDDPSRPSDETMPFYPFIEWLPYARSKSLAEHEVLRGVARGLDAVIAISTGIVGPNDFLPSRTGQTFLDMLRGKLPAYVPGGTEFVTTDDIVEGHVRAMHRGRCGERYIISTGYRSLDDMVDLFHEVSGAPKPRFRLSPRMMSICARIYEKTVCVAVPNAPVRFTPGVLHILGMHRRADITRARRELGFQPGDIRQAVIDLHEFFCRENMILGRP